MVARMTAGDLVRTERAGERGIAGRMHGANEKAIVYCGIKKLPYELVAI